MPMIISLFRLFFVVFLVLFGSNMYAQTRSELHLSLNNGFVTKNYLIGTSLEFEDFGANSSVNLKSKSALGINLNFQTFIKRSRFLLIGSFEERKIIHETTIFHPKYGGSETFNETENLKFKNTCVNLGLGLMYRLTFLQGKIEWDLGFKIEHRHFRDHEIQKRLIQNPNMEESESGDLAYNVSLNYYKLNQKLTLLPFTNLNFKLNSNTFLALQFKLNAPVAVEYVPEVFGLTKYDSGPISSSWAGQNFGNFNFQSNSFSIGIGIKYVIKNV